jgi:hypothetical protein
MTLIVKHAFGDYQRGDQITDAAQVAAALASHAGQVVRVASAALAPIVPPALPSVAPASESADKAP